MKGAMAKLFAKVLRISKASQVALVIKNLLASAGSVGDTGLIPESKRSLGGRHGNSLPYSCLKESHGQRSLAGYSPWDHRVGHDCVTFTFKVLTNGSLIHLASKKFFK